MGGNRRVALPHPACEPQTGRVEDGATSRAGPTLAVVFVSAKFCLTEKMKLNG